MMVDGGWMTCASRSSLRSAHESHKVGFHTDTVRIVVGHCLRFVSAIAIWKRRTYIRNSIVINWRCLIFRITQVNLEFIICQVISGNYK